MNSDDDAGGMVKHRLLVITNLFGYPWEPTRAMFNQQQFGRLAEHFDHQSGCLATNACVTRCSDVPRGCTIASVRHSC